MTVPDLTARWTEESRLAARERARESFEAMIAHANLHLARGEIVCDCAPWWMER